MNMQIRRFPYRAIRFNFYAIAFICHQVLVSRSYEYFCRYTPFFEMALRVAILENYLYMFLHSGGPIKQFGLHQISFGACKVGITTPRVNV